MSAISLPTGLIKDWCVQSLYSVNTTLNTCETTGAKADDYQTICCDGEIIDINADLNHATDKLFVKLEDLRCCSLDGPQEVNQLQPIGGVSNSATCSSGQPTPLASLAATNIHNAAPYEVTYTGAVKPSSTGSYVPQLIPTCLWANTKNGVAQQSTTVPKASITTPVPTGSTSASASAGDSKTSSASAQSSGSTDSASASTSSSPSASSSPATGAAPRNTGLIRGLLAGLSMGAIIVTML